MRTKVLLSVLVLFPLLASCNMPVGQTPVTQPAQPLPPTESALSAAPDWKEYHSDPLRLTFAYPATWAIQVVDNDIYLSSPDRSGFESDTELAYSVFVSERANPERHSFSDAVTEGLSEELKQTFSFTSVQIGDYLTYQTKSLPSQAGALQVFFENGDRYVEFGLAPYDSQNPFIGQDRHEKLFEAMLQTVRLTE
jgi:hypothetical protein